jgi:hypothetical protein
MHKISLKVIYEILLMEDQSRKKKLLCLVRQVLPIKKGILLSKQDILRWEENFRLLSQTARKCKRKCLVCTTLENIFKGRNAKVE